MYPRWWWWGGMLDVGVTHSINSTRALVDGGWCVPCRCRPPLRTIISLITPSYHQQVCPGLAYYQQSLYVVVSSWIFCVSSLAYLLFKLYSRVAISIFPGWGFSNRVANVETKVKCIKCIWYVQGEFTDCIKINSLLNHKRLWESSSKLLASSLCWYGARGQFIIPGDCLLGSRSWSLSRCGDWRLETGDWRLETDDSRHTFIIIITLTRPLQV